MSSLASTSRGLAPIRQVMPNGAVVVIKEAFTTPAVTIDAVLQAGSVYDPPEIPGRAHFLSGVIDRGTIDRSADAISDELDSRGVSLNISTTRHGLSIACDCLAEDFEPMLDLIADVIRRPVFPQDQVVTRRGEILTALRQDEDNPAVRAIEELSRLLYGSRHPYGRPSKGTMGSVRRIDRDVLVAAQAERFAPDALCLVIVGAIDQLRALDAAARLFGDWTGTAAVSPAFPPPGPEAGTRRSVVIPMMNKVQVDIAYGFRAVSRPDPGYYACSILNYVLGQYGLGGRLGENIRERQGMAYYAFSSLHANLLQGPLYIRAGVSPADVDRTIGTIDDEVTRMATEGITELELEDARRYLTGSIPRMLETNSRIAKFLHTTEQFGLGIDHDLRLPALLHAVAKPDVDRIAREILDPERAAIVVAGPYAPASGAIRPTETVSGTEALAG